MQVCLPCNSIAPANMGYSPLYKTRKNPARRLRRAAPDPPPGRALRFPPSCRALPRAIACNRGTDRADAKHLRSRLITLTDRGRCRLPTTRPRAPRVRPLKRPLDVSPAFGGTGPHSKISAQSTTPHIRDVREFSTYKPYKTEKTPPNACTKRNKWGVRSRL